MATVRQQPSVEEAARIYEQYAKPLESQHWEEFLAVSRNGEMLLAPTLVAAIKQATAQYGPGNLVFKVGERAVGKWRWLSTFASRLHPNSTPRRQDRCMKCRCM